MTDIVEFLRARLSEDEQRAEAARSGWDDEDSRYEWEDLPDAQFAHARWHDPLRVLREVEAKRRLLDAHPIEFSKVSDFTDCAACMDVDAYDAYPCLSVRLLALPYADHADFDESWRP